MTRRWLVAGLCAGLVGLSACTGVPATDPNDSLGTQEPNDGGASASATTLTGVVSPGQTAKAAPRAEETGAYTVVVQSDETGEVYRAETDADGAFEVTLPESENGNTMTVTLVGPDGRAVGPLVFDEADGNGVTGIKPAGTTDVGAIDVPADPTAAPLQPDGDVADLLDADVTTRVNDDGVPIGVATHGKGDDATSDDGVRDGAVDADRDGLIDIFDADDDGDGIIDDLDTGGSTTPADVRFGCFMNLKINANNAAVYYDGTSDEINARLKTDTIITIEVVEEPSATRAVASARVLETPGPAYMPNAVLQGEGDADTTWASTDYDLPFLENPGDRWGVWIVPHTLMDAGDSFTAEVTYTDGTSEQFTHMINYVFTNIPKLVTYGSPGTPHAFDVHDATVNGTDEHPIPFDATQDVRLYFEPPVDETGAPLLGLDYSFAVFYRSAAGAGGFTQLNSDIDSAATWPTPPTGFDAQNTTFYVDAGTLTYADGKYAFDLPHEIFVDTVRLTDGSDAAVASYQVDITAETTTGNAAILLIFERQ